MPRYDYVALNQLALDDSGHFVFLSAWQYVACLSIMEQASPLYLWMDDQHPLSIAEIDDLQAKLAEAQYQLMTPSLLTGAIMPICTENVPDGMLLCDGGTYQRVTFPALYAAIAPALRVDADYFTVPDLRQRFILGADTADQFDTGGSATHVQTLAELAPHSHTSPPHSHTESAAGPTAIAIGPGVPAPSAIPAVSSTGLTSVSIDSSGGGDPMDIMPPWYALRYAVIYR